MSISKKEQNQFLFMGAVCASAFLFFLPAGTQAAQVSVSVMDDSFSPRNITISQGDTVVWTNTGAHPHTVTSDSGLFNSGTIPAGATYLRTFTNSGTFPYYCIFHGSPGGGGMAGTITVLPSSTSNPYPIPPLACVNLTHDLSYGSSDYYTGGDVSRLQQFLRDQNYLPYTPTGYFGMNTYYAVTRFQQDYGISANGYVGHAMRAKIRSLTCSDPIFAQSTPPSIVGIDAPTELFVQQTGTWTVRVSSQSQAGSQLSYSVLWGDESIQPYGAYESTIQSPLQSSASFTHAYSIAGQYQPTFTVRNSAGQQTSASATLTVREQYIYTPRTSTYPYSYYYYPYYSYNHPSSYSYGHSYYPYNHNPYYYGWYYPSYSYSAYGY